MNPFKSSLSRALHSAFRNEMVTAKTAVLRGQYDLAFKHLERAHILGQRSFITHWTSHWWMLKVGWMRRDRREILGQLARLIAVVPGYLIGWVPKGNTGGADVSPLKPMAIPSDLAPLLKNYRVWQDVLVRSGFCLLLALLTLLLLGRNV